MVPSIAFVAATFVAHIVATPTRPVDYAESLIARCATPECGAVGGHTRASTREAIYSVAAEFRRSSGAALSDWPLSLHSVEVDVGNFGAGTVVRVALVRAVADPAVGGSYGIGGRVAPSADDMRAACAALAWLAPWVGAAPCTTTTGRSRHNLDLRAAAAIAPAALLRDGSLGDSVFARGGRVSAADAEAYGTASARADLVASCVEGALQWGVGPGGCSDLHASRGAVGAADVARGRDARPWLVAIVATAADGIDPGIPWNSTTDQHGFVLGESAQADAVKEAGGPLAELLRTRAVAWRRAPRYVLGAHAPWRFRSRHVSIHRGAPSSSSADGGGGLESLRVLAVETGGMADGDAGVGCAGSDSASCATLTGSQECVGGPDASNRCDATRPWDERAAARIDPARSALLILAPDGDGGGTVSCTRKELELPVSPAAAGIDGTVLVGADITALCDSPLLLEAVRRGVELGDASPLLDAWRDASRLAAPRRRLPMLAVVPLADVCTAVSGAGFHRVLDVTVDAGGDDGEDGRAVADGAAVGRDGESLHGLTCTLAVVLRVDATTYVDLDELRSGPLAPWRQHGRAAEAEAERRSGGGGGGGVGPLHLRAFSRFIDVERPAEASAQHELVLGVPVRVTADGGDEGARGLPAGWRADVAIGGSSRGGNDSNASQQRAARVRASVRVPLHMRYQAPGCAGTDGSGADAGGTATHARWLAAPHGAATLTGPSAEHLAAAGGGATRPYVSGCYAAARAPAARAFLRCVASGDGSEASAADTGWVPLRQREADAESAAATKSAAAARCARSSLAPVPVGDARDAALVRAVTVVFACASASAVAWAAVTGGRSRGTVPGR